MIVYDITKEQTFENCEKWYSKLKNSADENIVMMICGNKSDLTNERCVSQETGSEFAKNKEVLFIETSALDSTNVSKAFLTIV